MAIINKLSAEQIEAFTTVRKARNSGVRTAKTEARKAKYTAIYNQLTTGEMVQIDLEDGETQDDVTRGLKQVTPVHEGIKIVKPRKVNNFLLVTRLDSPPPKSNRGRKPNPNKPAKVVSTGQRGRPKKGA